ncbi:MAG: hypothetical protein WC666_03275 [Candidatus Paceibacterota bacterium]|jgi:hypothetical protein
MAISKRDLTNLWAHLSDAWGRFEDKSTIESMWTGVAAGSDLLMSRLLDVQNSRTMQYMPPIIEDGPMTFTIIESGTGANTVVITDGSGIFKTYINDWTLSIPTFTQSYYVVASGVTYTYTNNVDYTISGMNTLVWKTTPHWDQRYPSMHVLTLTADSVKRVNPVLTNLWLRLIDLELTDFNQYNIFQTVTDANKYKHLKNFVWALFHKRLQSPTIKTLEDALNIAAGMPFAYDAGIAVVAYVTDHYEVTIGTQTYTFPVGLTPIVINGATVKKFDILAKGIAVYDYYNNPSVVGAVANVLTKYNTFIIQTTAAQATLVSKSSTYYAAFKTKLLPVQFLTINTTV